MTVTVGADQRVWRVTGDPLVAGARGGDGGASMPLSGLRVAVKDLFAVRGQRVGAGSIAFLAQAPVQARHAPAVAALLAAGADVVGIAQTDQFAYSIAGLNPDYGAAPNPAVPGGIPGGSSSGPASAVALGQADIGLGTDTAGSIRVPASYQGLWGLRTTHGAVPVDGVLPLAPRYDTVGWIARDGATLLAAARANGLGVEGWRREAPAVRRFLTAPGLATAAEPTALESFNAALERLCAARPQCDVKEVELPPAEQSFAAFRVTQSAQAWRSHGEWVTANPGVLAPDIAERFAFAASVTADQERAADAEVRRLAAAIDAALGDDIVLLPSAASAAPALDADDATLQRLREATLGITAVAGFTGRPALSVPWATTPGGPLGVCLVGPRGSDAYLIELALAWEAS